MASWRSAPSCCPKPSIFDACSASPTARETLLFVIDRAILIILLASLAALAALGLYALRQSRPADVPAVLTTGARPVLLLVLVALALLLTYPADVPTLLRAALASLAG
ncbi:hypothetical protein ACWCYK_31525 [Streptomyces lydicamycinicus]